MSGGVEVRNLQTPAIPAIPEKMRCSAMVAALALFAMQLLAGPPSLHAGPVAGAEADRVTLAGNVHPLARPENDLGPTDPALPMSHVVVLLDPGAARTAALDRLVAEQQDPASANFHRWLGPEEYAARFGLPPAEVSRVADWLRAQGFAVHSLPRGRGWITFAGTAGLVNRAFHTEMHDYRMNGAVRHANAFDPSIPRQLAGLIAGVVGLNDVPLHAAPPAAAAAAPPPPRRTADQPDCFACSGTTHNLGPADFALLYDLDPLYQSGIDGSGQTIAIVASSDIKMSDVTAFRSYFGLPATTPVGGPPVVVEPPTDTCPDPSFTATEGEADLDVQWSGATARSATVLFVPCGTVNSVDGSILSAMAIVDNDLAPVLSMSFGSCESAQGQGGNATIASLWMRAAAQGISVLVASGDSGAAGCDVAQTESVATHGLGVNAWCSTPYGVCVGGTEFDEGDPATYWGSNTDPTQPTVLRYIPEVAWNESADDGGSGIWASGGGVSETYAAPSWQLPLDTPGTMRAVPDVALTAAAHDGYLIFQNYAGAPLLASGTSAAAPAFAAMMALVVQRTGQRQGNPAPVLYQLADLQESGAAGQIFHDVKAGDNSVPGVSGYSCKTGYDLVTGLGSLDAAALVDGWPSPGATLTANPAAGAAPFTTILTAQATGPGYGTLNYTFWWDCPFAVSTVAAGIAQCGDPSNNLAIGAKVDSVPDLSVPALAPYPSAGTFTPLVIVERNAGAFPAAARVVVSGSAACTSFAISPPSAGTGSAAGAQKVVVAGAPSGCQGGAWTAAGNGSWLTVSPASGSGSGSVTVAWTANTAASARSSSVTIAGASFAVTQAGTTATAPAAPFLVFPGAAVLPGVTLSTLTFTFDWQAVAGADSYQIELSDLSQGGAILSTPTIQAPAASYAQTAALADNQSYQWRMRSHGAAGWGAYGGYYYFSIYTGLATGDFSLAAVPPAGAVTPGASAAFVIGTTTTQGSAQVLTFAAGTLPAGVTASFSPVSTPSGGQTTLTLAVGAGVAPGAYSIAVTATGASHVAHSIAIGLTVNPPPQTGQPAICLTPAALSFSDQMVGTASPVQVVTLRNCGNGPLSITALGASPEFFVGPGSIVPPVSLVAGGATTFSVGFAPLGSGARSGSVRIASNAAGSPTFLPLSGPATPAPSTTGTVNVVATLNGQPFSGDVGFSVTGPGGTIDFGNAPLSWASQGAGSYTVALTGGNPGGGTLVGITPAPTQMLTAGGSVLFTMAFTAADNFGFSCPAAILTGTTSLMVTAPGGSANVGLQAVYAGGSAQTIALAVAGLPADATGTFAPQPMNLSGASATSTFTVTTAASTPPGLYQLTFSATNQDGTTHTLTGVLVVVSAIAPQMVSAGTGGAPANGLSDEPSVSADGRYVAFASLASNLAAGAADTNGSGDVFVRDTQAGTTALVSVVSGGGNTAGTGFWPSISADGRYVAFSSNGNLAPGGGSGADVYVRDLQLGQTVRACMSSAGVPADSACLTPSISGDGRYVAFSSAATTLVPGGGGGVSQIYVRDLKLGTTALVSVADGGALGNANSTSPTISGDGQTVAFVSAASNFVAGATAAGPQVFLRDLRAGTTAVVSAAPDGSAANGFIYINTNSGERLAVTPDGRFVAFASFATNLVPGNDNDFNSDVFVWDRTTQASTVVSVANDGSFLLGAGAPSLSADGRFVTFWLQVPDAGAPQLAVRDTVTMQTLLLSIGAGGAVGNAFSAESSLSAGGRVLAFASGASNLVAGDTNGQEDVFAVTLPGGGSPFAMALAVSPASVPGGVSATGTITLSAAAPAGGATVALSSSAIEAAVPPVVVVPAGSTSATFPIATLAVTSELPASITASYGGGSPWVLLTLEPPSPARIDVLQGSGQTAAAGSPLPVALAARVVDAANNPLPGVAVQFAAPANGPSGTFAGGVSSVLVGTDASGVATAPTFTVTGTLGPFVVVASVAGIASPAVFTVTTVRAGLKFYTVAPCRIIDTRGAAGSFGAPALQPSAQRTFAVAGTCGIPGTAQSISVNVTVTGPTSAGLLSLGPGGQPAPGTSAISFAAGATQANNAVLGLSTDGTGSFVVLNGSAGTVQFILDVNGYFQ
jgi:pseudomonalisin